MQIRKYINAVKRYVCNSDYRFRINSAFGKYDATPDGEYLERKFECCMGRPLDLENPQTFNEKLQWLKLYDRNPEYPIMVDKYKVRKYIKEKIGEEYLIPLLGVWDTPDEIDFDALPNEFVLKCNHNSGRGMCICKDKSKLSIEKVKSDLKKGLKQDYYLTGREWPYKDVPRKIIAEQFMKSDAGGLTDYKVHCFNGEPKIILVCRDRFAETGLTEDFFSAEWEHLDLRRPTHPNAMVPTAKPDELDHLLELSRILSKDIPFLRVDFYIVEGHVFFSELTFFPASGFERFEPEKWDHVLGDWLKIPDVPAI